MVSEIYLTRHGLVNEKGDLNEKGINFSKDLPKLLENRNIELILCDDEQRCRDTMFYLISERRIKQDYRKKEYFKSKKILEDFSSYSSILICYRYESIQYIQQELGLYILGEHNRNQGYEFIFYLFKENDKWILKERISTGYKKQ